MLGKGVPWGPHPKLHSRTQPKPPPPQTKRHVPSYTRSTHTPQPKPHPPPTKAKATPTPSYTHPHPKLHTPPPQHAPTPSYGHSMPKLHPHPPQATCPHPTLQLPTCQATHIPSPSYTRRDGCAGGGPSRAHAMQPSGSVATPRRLGSGAKAIKGGGGLQGLGMGGLGFSKRSGQHQSSVPIWKGKRRRRGKPVVIG